MQRFGKLIGVVFGIIMTALSVLITVETVVRKLFSISLGGVDELSGYAIAVGAPLAFAVAAIEMSHIRINLAYARMPVVAQAAANCLTALSIAAISIFFLYFSLQTLRETITYSAIAQTPWATPLVYPQSLWFGAMLVFAAVALWLCLRALALAIRQDVGRLSTSFGPERVEDELEAELSDMARR